MIFILSYRKNLIIPRLIDEVRSPMRFRNFGIVLLFVLILPLETMADDIMNTDSDSDGIPDCLEDTNGNSIVDAGETDPLNSDTDGDGLLDGEEDLNKNGMTDGSESDPLNADTDGDGMPDGWEVRYGFDPLVDSASDDTDGDGFSNLAEYNSGTDPTDAGSKPALYHFRYDSNGNLEYMQQPSIQPQPPRNWRLK
ncbi:MAG: hypothetical protein PVH87_19870 [Desulfobacteraceae bacterium]